MASMHEDFDLCARAVRSRDARFDGWFYTAVLTTGIYCRPSCPARPPKPQNLRFYPSAAAAQQAGFRACKRCRPDASPGSPEWNGRADVVARAMRLIADGMVEERGVEGLARHLGYSARQIERHLSAEVGAGPLALARAQRAQTARLLIETTDLPMGEVAFGAGFASVRSFNETVRAVFDVPPSELRRRAQRRAGTAAVPPGSLLLRLPFRQPLFPDNLFGHLAATAVPGVEEWRNGWYRRTLRLVHGSGVVALQPHDDYVACHLRLDDLRDLTSAANRCRHMLDLDADPVAIDEQLAADHHLADLVAAAPGRRVPRTVDPAEMCVRAVLGQQVSTAAARTHAARLVTAHGCRVADPDGGLTHLFPEVGRLAGVDPATLAMPSTRRATLVAVATALDDGTLQVGPGVDRERARAQLSALRGVGPWTVETIAMRALGDPDAFLAGDLGIVKAAASLGITKGRAGVERASHAWRPWRSYAVQHLWALGDHPINRLPGAEERKPS